MARRTAPPWWGRGRACRIGSRGRAIAHPRESAFDDVAPLVVIDVIGDGAAALRAAPIPVPRWSAVSGMTATLPRPRRCRRVERDEYALSPRTRSGECVDRHDHTTPKSTPTPAIPCCCTRTSPTPREPRNESPIPSQDANPSTDGRGAPTSPHRLTRALHGAELAAGSVPHANWPSQDQPRFAGERSHLAVNAFHVKPSRGPPERITRRIAAASPAHGRNHMASCAA